MSFDMELKDLNLDVRCYNAIVRYFHGKEGITVKDVCSLTTKQLLLLRNIGIKGLEDTIKILHLHGFFLADEEKDPKLVSIEQQIYDLKTKKETVTKRINVLQTELEKMNLLNKQIDLALNEICNNQKGTIK